MTVAISVENLSKKYLIRHQTAERYTALRDVLANGARRLGRTLARPFLESGAAQGVDPAEEEFWALRDLNFEIPEGDRVGIIGSNGAGKSTLLKILSRVTEPTRGKIRIAGRVASLLEVGTGFHPELTGRENVFLNGAILGMGKAEIAKKFDEIVAFAGVDQFIDTPVKRYSSGMYVRLAFSVVAHIDPDVLVVDEVLAVGDLQFQRRCLSRMKELEAAGRTVLFVTHNMDAMMALCNRAIVLDAGRIVFDGTAAKGRNRYIELQSSRERSLARNSGRGGSGAARVESVAIVGSASGKSGQIATGDGITIEISFKRAGSLPPDARLDLGIGIDTGDGTRLFTSVSSWTGVTYDSQHLDGKATCEIETLPLVPGTYLLSVALIYRGESLDVIQHCASFEIVEPDSDIYKQRLEGFGSLQIPCRFR